MTSLLIYSFSN